MESTKETEHIVYFRNSADMDMIPDSSVQLVVTSPPYPMIEMWDECFSQQSHELTIDDIVSKPDSSYNIMHNSLKKIWEECYRILQPGCIMCINIGDAVRTISGEFRLFDNHSRIIEICSQIGFHSLPNIVWSKPVNAPNKFMGSGCLPCNAYVTLEHEHILIFRKPGKRLFETNEEKLLRKESSCFFEERNIWYSDMWRINGYRQKIVKKSARTRNASYPIEIPYRLINMYSCVGDTVVDPFYGLGTTTMAAMMSRRNSIGFEIEPSLSEVISDNIYGYDINSANKHISDRYNRHLAFMRERKDDNKNIYKYSNKFLKCPVVSAAEEYIRFYYLKNIEKEIDNSDMLKFKCFYNSQKNVNESFNESALF